MRLALAQINTIVGDIPGNVNNIARTLRSAKDKQADLVIFPEMCICGYPPEDLLRLSIGLEDEEELVDDLAQALA